MEKPQDALSLKITSWNVLNEGYENPEYYATGSHPYLRWSDGRKERAVSYMDKVMGDVTCLQEVSKAMAQQLAPDPLYWPYDMVWQPRTQLGDRVEDGLAVVYQTQKLTLLNKFTWRYASGKHIFLACLFSINGVKNPVTGEKKLWVVNTHVNWKTRLSDLVDLMKQLGEHAAFLASPAPQVVMGDFNATRDEAGWYSQLGKYGVTDALSNLRVEPRGLLGDGTNKDLVWPYSYNSGKMSKWIDHFLLRGFATTSPVKEILVNGSVPFVDYAFDIATLPNATIPSDHLPVTVVLIQ
jgi:mRNA deadenylase 3'-5' endonuclease subunit Ccr4